MTEREYFALMAEYLAQLEQASRNQYNIFATTPKRASSLYQKVWLKEEWARRQVDAVFDTKETDHEKPA